MGNNNCFGVLTKEENLNKFYYDLIPQFKELHESYIRDLLKLNISLAGLKKNKLIKSEIYDSCLNLTITNIFLSAISKFGIDEIINKLGQSINSKYIEYLNNKRFPNLFEECIDINIEEDLYNVIKNTYLLKCLLKDKLSVRCTLVSYSENRSKLKNLTQHIILSKDNYNLSNKIINIVYNSKPYEERRLIVI